MICRRLAPLVVLAFLAAHVAACACRVSGTGSKAPEEKSHSCCGETKPPPSPKPAPVSCCCSDGSHEAISEHPGEPASQSAMLDAVFELPPAFTAGQASRISVFAGSPPGRAPGVSLFILHAALLI